MQYFCIQCGAKYNTRVAMCLSCLSFGVIAPLFVRPVERGLAEMAVVGADKFADCHWVLFGNVFGIEFGEGALVLLWGPPGSGKSTMLLSLLNSLAGRVLYVSIEESFSPSLGMRLQSLGVSRSDFRIASAGGSADLVEVIRTEKPKYVGIDSISASVFKPSDLRKIQVLGGGQPMFGILHANKQGQYYGSAQYGHEADVVIRVEEMKWLVEKNRYGKVGKTGDVKIDLLRDRFQEIAKLENWYLSGGVKNDKKERE